MLKMLLRVSFVFFFFFHLLEQIGRGREMIVSKYEGRYFSFEKLFRRRERVVFIVGIIIISLLR